MRSRAKAERIEVGTAIMGSIVTPQPGSRSAAVVMMVIQIVSCTLLRTGTSIV